MFRGLQVWEKLDKKFLDPTKVRKGVKKDLASLNRKKLGDTKYLVSMVDKLLDAESLLDSVGMAHWLRQEDKVPEYEDMLTKAELLEWVRLLQSVWLAPDLPVSFFFFLMESTISTSSSLWLGV